MAIYRPSERTDAGMTAQSVGARRARMATAAVIALLILATAAGCGQAEECRSWYHGDPMPTKDNPAPTPVMRCNDP